MSVFNNLLSRLHRVFNKDPDRIPVMAITCTDPGAEITTNSLILVGTGGLSVDFSELTLQQLATAIGTFSGYSATLVSASYASLLARAVMEDGTHKISADTHLYYPTSQLWLEMQTYAWILDEQAERLRQLTKQLYLHSADTDWLDYWLQDFFGIPRDGAETDPIYQRRGINEIVSLNQNNIAIENLIEGSLTNGIPCQVIDSAIPSTRLIGGKRPLTWFRVISVFDITGPEPFSANSDKVIRLVNKAKAAGTKIEEIVVGGYINDQFAMVDNLQTATTAQYTDPLSLTDTNGLNLFYTRNGTRDGSARYNGAWLHNTRENFNQTL
jgi:hypothetical protein